MCDYSGLGIWETKKQCSITSFKCSSIFFRSDRYWQEKLKVLYLGLGGSLFVHASRSPTSYHQVQICSQTLGSASPAPLLPVPAKPLCPMKLQSSFSWVLQPGNGRNSSCTTSARCGPALLSAAEERKGKNLLSHTHTPESALPHSYPRPGHPHTYP